MIIKSKKKQVSLPEGGLTMKILHLADLHLGKSVVNLSMLESQQYVLNQAIDLCKKEGIKHIIISGDVYDRSIPPEGAVSLLNDFLSKVVLDEKIHVYMISGNHDSKERLSCFNGILEKQGLFIDSGVSDELLMSKHVIEEDGLKVNIYSLPYFYPSEIRVKTGDDAIKDYETAINKVLGKNTIDNKEINILNAHFFVTSDGGDPIRSDSESKTSVGTIEQVSFRVFDMFDYVALGHLHCPQCIGKETVRYAGSPLKYSVDEIGQRKVFNIINIKSKDDINFKEIDITPLYKFVYMEGTVDELTQNSDEKDFSIVFFKLTDTSHVLNAATRLKIKYPHYVGLQYVNIKDDVDENETSLAKEEGFNDLTIEEQFYKFFRFINDKDLDQTQKEAIKTASDELEKENQ